MLYTVVWSERIDKKEHLLPIAVRTQDSSGQVRYFVRAGKGPGRQAAKLQRNRVSQYNLLRNECWKNPCSFSTRDSILCHTTANT